jgi:hypothetical protein
MATKFLYLDDEELDRVQPTAEAVAGDDGTLIIDIFHPGKFENKFAELVKKLKSYDSLILDWRLDAISDPEQGQKFTFRAGAIAQEIRTRETDQNDPIAPLPIILWSTQEKLAASFNRDNTSHDLFDGKYIKDGISENPKLVRQELISFVTGYKAIAKFAKKTKRNFHELLGAEKDFIDIRIQERFSNDRFPIHEYARFIKRELIDRPGLLVDENRLAARLGINKNRSKDWNNLVDLLSIYKYTGPFREAWSRWWSDGIEKKWWNVTLEQKRPLSLLIADERVKIIKEKTGLKKLIPAMPIKPNYHSRFYTICEHCREPLDPIDGIILAEKEPEPWQERKYISIDVALERREGFDPHPTELERLRSLRRAVG